MDFISTALVSLSQPTGFWESILNAFKGATGTYIVAVILISLIVRVLFSLVDIVNKKVTMKSGQVTAKMQPELDAIKAKYGHDQALYQQKVNEVYKKYQFNVMGSCFPMLIMMVLQFTVFLTLWNSLQAVSNFNIASQYQNMKEVYVNIINLNEVDSTDTGKTALQNYLKTEMSGKTYSLEAEIDFENKNMTIYVSEEGGETKDYSVAYEDELSNEEIYNIISTFVEQAAEEGEEGGEIQSLAVTDTGLNDVFKAFAERTAKDYYTDTQEGFLWIKNVYKAESPTSPLFTKDEIKGYLGNFYTEEEKTEETENDYEGKIFDNVVAGIDTDSLGVNGYYILTIIAVLTSFLSTWLSNKLMKQGTNPQKKSWAMYIVMPLIIGIFTFMYTSLFAVYLIVGQLIMLLVTPLTTWVVKKWLAADAKKQKDKNVIEVDYRRKDN
ncbi:MAG: YidC/Oxa1 family membrane protein insertase [Clostridia bacterium]|nr:YidC/Oxa1 family membrane protein insertase [Clostridia bacterium]